jgi:deazaflavin-dependent oxidoreductase (nitroreductase family)
VAADDGEEASTMTTTTPSEERGPWLPPRWFIRTAWVVHRAIHRITGGRRGLALPKPDGAGYLRLHSIGRQSGRERLAILACVEDGPNLATLAMNGWADPDPAWWLNLLARPDATIDLKDGTRHVHAREAQGEERERIWARINAASSWGSDLTAYAKRRSRETAVVVFEPRATP